MNKRIRELAERAGFIAVSDPEAPVLIVDNYDGIVTAELEKFAELIVRECAKVAFDDWCEGTNESSSEQAILKHFGVAE